MLFRSFIHRRKFGTIWSDEDKFRPKEFIRGLLIFFVLFGIAHFITYAVNPSDYKFVFNADQFFIFLPAALIMVPIQTLSEEMFFRGYLYQAFGIAFRKKWMALIISSIFFGLFHFGNPEMAIDPWKMGFVYIGSGFMIGLCVMFSKGIEFGWGFHLINNLYLSLIVTWPGRSEERRVGKECRL